MTFDDYERWAQLYAARVGLNYDGGLEMVLAWWPDIKGAGITVGLLHTAGDHAAAVITASPPRMREGHRGILFGAIDALVVRSGDAAKLRQTRELMERNRSGDRFDRAWFRAEMERRGWKIAWSEPL